MWEEAGVPRKNPRRHWENMQTQHLKAPPESNPGPPCCEATMLIPAPPGRCFMPKPNKGNVDLCQDRCTWQGQMPKGRFSVSTTDTKKYFHYAKQNIGMQQSGR